MYFKISKFFLYLVPLSVMIVSTSTLFPFIVGKYVFFRTAVGLSLIFFLLGLLFQYKDIRSPKVSGQYLGDRMPQIFKSPLVIAVSVFVFIFLLACFFGVDPKTSFWSNFERGEGGLQMLNLYAFFILLLLLFREEKDWRKLFVFMIIGGLGMALYGFLAGLGVQNFIGPKFSDPDIRFQGSIGNPAYVAAYAIFMLFYIVYLLASKYKNRLLSFGAIILWVLMLVFFAVFFAAATRGAFMGLVASVFIFICYLVYAFKRWRKWFLGIGMLLLTSVILLIQFRDMPFVKSLPASRIFDISFSAETFKHRAIMWQVAIDGWKERPILGWGPENYIKVFDTRFRTDYFEPSQGFGAWFDRAHSIYFDYLVQTGILGLLSFLGIWIVFYWQFFKTRTNTDLERTYTDRNSKLLYEDLTYKIRGIIFDIKKQLRLGHKEIVYQNALEVELKKRNIFFEREKPIDVKYDNKKVGIYKPDFIVENKIVLELKSLPFLGKNEKKQIWHYLRGSPYKLALLVNFGRIEDVQIERVIYAPGLSKFASSVSSQHQSASTPKSAESVLSPLQSALLFALPIAYLVQGIVLFDVYPIYLNVFLILAFVSYKLGTSNK